MSQPRKTKKSDIEKLHQILDNPSNPKLKEILSMDDESLKSIYQRMTRGSKKKDTRLRPSDLMSSSAALQPRVTVHTRTESIQKPEEPKINPKTKDTSPLEEENFDQRIESKDLYEIERIDIFETQ